MQPHRLLGLVKDSASTAVGSHMRSVNYYNVRPRYTPGSPAMVNGRTASKVAKDEKEFYEYALSGTWGEKEKTRAEIEGLRGIA